MHPYGKIVLAAKQAARRLSLTVLLLFITVSNAAPVPKDARKEPTKTLEEKFHGNWEGGVCIGTISFKADGTYQRLNYSPAGLNMSGEWTVKWDALPPTLVLTCKTSNESERVGKELKVKIIELNDTSFKYAFEEGDEAYYKRGSDRMQATVRPARTFIRTQTLSKPVTIRGFTWELWKV